MWKLCHADVYEFSEQIFCLWVPVAPQDIKHIVPMANCTISLVVHVVLVSVLLTWSCMLHRQPQLSSRTQQQLSHNSFHTTAFTQQLSHNSFEGLECQATGIMLLPGLGLIYVNAPGVT